MHGDACGLAMTLPEARGSGEGAECVHGIAAADMALPGQVPTFRADPLTPACDSWCEFPVSDRPNAVAQFMAAAVKDPSMIKASALPHLLVC